MSISRGPLRIVLLQSGGYDYAELELQHPVHLVAGNNVGKTSLIAALQFLYIDDARQMHFSHGWRETKQHYFPDSRSFMLFECMTPTGLQVFGLRGQGPVQGFEYDRFVYTGAYLRDDFLDGRTPRSWEEVRRRLVSRELRPMEPRHLRASLTGSGDTKGPPLGLVPLRRSGSFDSFRFLFRNLLRLSRIEQKQLKELFIDICRPRLRQVEVDLKRDYAEMFGRVERDARDVEALQVVAPEIEALVTHYEERQTLRGRLVAAWRRIERLLEDERVRVHDEIAALHERRVQSTAAIEAIEARQADAEGQVAQIGEQRGGLKRDLGELEALRDRTLGFVPELEGAARHRLEGTIENLVARLAGAKRADRREVEAELARLRTQVARDEQLVERFADAVVTWLRARSGLDDSGLADVFTVANPALLGEILGEGRVVVEDADAVLDLVRRIAAGFDQGGFTARGVRIRRRGPSEPSPLGDFQDVEAVRWRVARHRERLTSLEQILADITERERLEQALDEARDSLDEAREQLRDWESWQQRRPELEDLSVQMEALEEQATELRAHQRRLREDHTRLSLEQAGFGTQSERLQESLRRLVAEVQRLSRPPVAWPEGGLEEEDASATIGGLLSRYRSGWSRHTHLDGQVEKRFGDVEHQTAGRHQGSDEAETIARLLDELQALDARQRAVQELWTSLVDGMRSAFKSLVEAVDEVRREVSRLTAALGRRQVSNLERIELQLVKQRDILERLRAVIDADEAPLFAGPGGRTRAARDVQAWLENRSRIDLVELFDLRFRIVDVRGQQKSFDSLSQIESQGTSTTIKVLVHLELLRTMLADDDIVVPFFLDEVATLDQANLGALIDHATGMGFMPVVASPHASDCVDTLYFLRRSDGGLVLDGSSRLFLRRGGA